MTDERWTAWLAAMIDAEGYIELQLAKDDGPRRRRHGAGPRIGITNTDLGILLRCREILRDLGCGEIEPRSAGVNPLGKRPCYALRVCNRVAVVRLIDAVSPFLIRLKPKAVLLRQYLVLREESLAAKYNAPYSDAEDRLIAEFRGMSSRTKGG